MGISARVETAAFTEKIKEYQELTGKAMGEVVKEQSRLLAERLTKFTFPSSQAQGRKRVAIDIGRVYLAPKWFTDVFQFRNVKLGERVKDLVRAKDAAELWDIFKNSAKLSLIRFEGFDPGRHRSLRRNGRVLVPDPRSFPLEQQSAVNQYLKAKQKNVGLAKSGWAACSAALGKSTPDWLSKSGTGSVTDKSDQAADPHVLLTNSVPYFAAMDSRVNIVSRALEGRGRDMIKSAEKQLEEAARKAGLHG